MGKKAEHETNEARRRDEREERQWQSGAAPCIDWRYRLGMVVGEWMKEWTGVDGDGRGCNWGFLGRRGEGSHDNQQHHGQMKKSEVPLPVWAATAHHTGRHSASQGPPQHIATQDTALPPLYAPLSTRRTPTKDTVFSFSLSMQAGSRTTH